MPFISNIHIEACVPSLKRPTWHFEMRINPPRPKLVSTSCRACDQASPLPAYWRPAEILARIMSYLFRSHIKAWWRNGEAIIWYNRKRKWHGIVYYCEILSREASASPWQENKEAERSLFWLILNRSIIKAAAIFIWLAARMLLT